MSYDLTLKLNPKKKYPLELITGEVSSLESLSFCEITSGNQEIILSLPQDDETIHSIMKSLKEYCLKNSHTLFDPQTGKDLDLTQVPKPLKKSTLKSKIKKFYKANLIEHSFQQTSPIHLERILPDLKQTIEFQPGRGSDFTINLFWRCTFVPNETLLSYSTCIHRLLDERGQWFTSWDNIEEYILTLAIPFLNKYTNIKQIVQDLESNTLNSGLEFREEDVLYDLMRAYAFLGEKEKAEELWLELTKQKGWPTTKTLKEKKERLLYERKVLDSLYLKKGN